MTLKTAILCHAKNSTSSAANLRGFLLCDHEHGSKAVWQSDAILPNRRTLISRVPECAIGVSDAAHGDALGVYPKRVPSGLAPGWGPDRMAKHRVASVSRVRSKGVRVGYFDCFSGTAGDMTMAALVDAGVDRRPIHEAVASLGLPCELTFETVRRADSGRPMQRSSRRTSTSIATCTTSKRSSTRASSRLARKTWPSGSS